MKNHVLKSLLGLALIAFTFSGCDLLDKADDVTFDVEVDVTFVTDENLPATNKVYAGEPVLLDLTTNVEVLKYADKIKKIEVTKIEYSITGYAAEPAGTNVTFSNGKMVYAASATGAKSDLSTVSMVNLATAGSGTFALPIVDANFTALGDLLLDEKKAYVFTTGTLSSTPVQFNVPTTFFVKITANALD
jgi:hypothetical protein